MFTEKLVVTLSKSWSCFLDSKNSCLKTNSGSVNPDSGHGLGFPACVPVCSHSQLCFLHWILSAARCWTWFPSEDTELESQPQTWFSSLGGARGSAGSAEGEARIPEDQGSSASRTCKTRKRTLQWGVRPQYFRKCPHLKGISPTFS